MDINKICPGCMRELQNKAQINCCPHCGYKFNDANIASHQLRPYTLLDGKYMVGKVIGEGGFGITYLGYDINLEIAVAIKEFYPNGYVTRDAGTTAKVTIFAGNNEKDIQKWRDNFIREARSLARFSNLNGIVEVRDFFNENDTAYIVMEYIDGTTLKSYLKQCGGKIPQDKVFSMMEPVINSLAKVHEAGVIHRDISPDNIMITKTGAMKLLDFGAARDISANGEKSLSVMLKPGYAPEEQYRTRGSQGPWSDVYALCATIYKCITGVTPVESMERLRNDDLKMPSALGISIDPNKEAALAKGMAVIAENRFQNMNQLHTALYSGVRQPMPVQQMPIQQNDDNKTIPLIRPQAQQTAYQKPVQQTAYQQPVQQTAYQQPMQQTAYQQPQGNGIFNDNNKMFIIVGVLAAVAVLGIVLIAAVSLGGSGNKTDTSVASQTEETTETYEEETAAVEETVTEEAVIEETFTDEDREYLNSLCEKTDSCASIYDYQDIMNELCNFMEEKGDVQEAMPQINEITSKYYQCAYQHYNDMISAQKILPGYQEIQITCDTASEYFNRLRNIGLEPVDYNNVQALEEGYKSAYKEAWAQEFDNIAQDNINNSSSHTVSRSAIWECIASLDNQDEDFQDFISSLNEHNDPLGMRYRVGLALHVDELTQGLSGYDAGGIINEYMVETDYNPLMVALLADRAGSNAAKIWLNDIDSILGKYSVAGYENVTFSQLSELDKRNYVYYLISYPNAMDEVRQYMSESYIYSDN